MNKVYIGNPIGKKEPVFIVCEVGMNHMGDRDYADSYIEKMLSLKPNGVTFQVREKEYYTKQKPEESTLLSDNYYRSAARRLQEGNIKFGIGLCDPEKVPFFEEISTDFYKILSKDINNYKLIEAALETNKPIYISTGMSDEEEISKLLKNVGKNMHQVSLIHTQLSYDDTDTNLRAILRLYECFHIPVAFGLHSTDHNALYAALSFNPSAIFFYVRGNHQIKHKDEDHAVRLLECSGVISSIRRLEIMMGDGIKKKMENRIADQKK